MGAPPCKYDGDMEIFNDVFLMGMGVFLSFGATNVPWNIGFTNQPRGFYHQQTAKETAMHLGDIMLNHLVFVLFVR